MSSVIFFALNIVGGELTKMLIISALIFLIVLWFRERRRNDPPGPLANHIPIFGFLPFLGGSKPPYVVLSDLAEKYGRIFKVKMGSQVMVIITDPKLLKEVFKRDDVTNRPGSPLNDGVMDGYGISAAEGNLWKSQRRFAQTCLRDVGFLKSSLKNKMNFEDNAIRAIDIFIQELSDTKGEAVDMERMLSFTVANIFFTIVVNKTFDLYDPVLMKELDDLTDSFRIIESINLANFIPIFCYLPKFKQVLKTVMERRESTRNLFRKIVKEHRETLDVNYPRDIIDAFLINMDRDSQEGVTTYFTEVQLLSMLGDLYSAGTETTKTTLRWLLLALTRNPDIQKKVHKELDAVIGRNRVPVLSDRAQLPYLEATVQETLRISSIVPMGNPHCPRNDIVVDGYHIAKGTMVTGLLWRFHRDPKLWPDPDQFNPERFINNGNKVPYYENFMPFSTGRRICLGEDVARNEIFLIAASVLQKFQFVPDDSGCEVLPTLDDNRGGFLRTPPSYKVKAIARFIF